MLTTVYLVRHAQSQPSLGVHTREWALTPFGHAQADRLAIALARLGIDEIYSSPYRRCLETIEGFTAATGVPLGIDGALRERLFAPGVIDDFDELFARTWLDFDFALPGCESSTEAQQRVVAALRAIVARASSATIGVVSHGNLLSLLLNSVDPRFGAEHAAAMRTPEVFRLRCDQGAFRWDAAFRLPELDDFASAFSQTHFPRSGQRTVSAG